MKTFGGMVNHCTCFRKSFRTLKNLCLVNDLKTVDDIARETKCGTKCGLCVPYMQKMLDTGKVEFSP